MAFDPDKYLAKPTNTGGTVAFDPDAYLAKKPAGFDPDAYLAQPNQKTLKSFDKEVDTPSQDGIVGGMNTNPIYPQYEPEPGRVEPQNKGFSLSDLKQSVTEIPQNLKIGTVGLGASILESIKKRGMQLSGAGIFPDETVRSQFEAVKPTQQPYGKRADGTDKGKGYFGEIPMRDNSGRVATEISVGVDFNGKETQIPTLVPTLTEDEKDLLLRGGKPTQAIIDKAISHAKKRFSEGKSPYADEADRFATLGPANRKGRFEMATPQDVNGLPLPGALTAEAVGTVTRMPDVGAKLIREKQQTMQETLPADAGPATRLARLVHQNTPSMAASVVASLLTGDPLFGLAMLGETEGGASFQRQLDTGASVGKAAIVSDLSEAAEIGGEMLVFPKLIKGFKKAIPLQDAFKIILENAGQEGATGFVQQFLDTVSTDTTKGVALKDAVQNGFDAGLRAVPENALVGGITAGMIETVSQGPGGVKQAYQGVKEAINSPYPDAPQGSSAGTLTPSQIAALDQAQTVRENAATPAAKAGGKALAGDINATLQRIEETRSLQPGQRQRVDMLEGLNKIPLLGDLNNAGRQEQPVPLLGDLNDPVQAARARLAAKEKAQNQPVPTPAPAFNRDVFDRLAADKEIGPTEDTMNQPITPPTRTQVDRASASTVGQEGVSSTEGTPVITPKTTASEPATQGAASQAGAVRSEPAAPVQKPGRLGDADIHKMVEDMRSAKQELGQEIYAEQMQGNRNKTTEIDEKGNEISFDAPRVKVARDKFNKARQNIIDILGITATNYDKTRVKKYQDAQQIAEGLTPQQAVALFRKKYPRYAETEPKKDFSSPSSEAGVKTEPAAPVITTKIDKEKLQSTKQMLEDLIANAKSDGRKPNQAWLDRLTQVTDQLEGTTDNSGFIASNQVFGNPLATGSPEYQALIPIKIREGTDITSYISKAQKMLDALQTKIATQDAVAKGRIKATPSQVKAAKQYAKSMQQTEDESFRDLLRQETLPELYRLEKVQTEKFGSAVADFSSPSSEAGSAPAGPALSEGVDPTAAMLEKRIQNATDEDMAEYTARHGELTPEQKEKVKSDAVKTWTGARDRMVEMVKNKDIKLLGVLHTGNPFSRKVFTALTGIKLPNTEGKTKEVVGEFVGKEKVAAMQAEKDAAKPVKPAPLTKEEVKAKMAQARQDKFLDGKIRHNGEVMTRREMVEGFVKEGRKPTIKTYKKDVTKSVQEEYERYRRNYGSFGNPNHPGYKKYQELKKQVEDRVNVTEYRADSLDNKTTVVLSKMEYDYFKGLVDSKPAGPLSQDTPTSAGLSSVDQLAAEKPLTPEVKEKTRRVLDSIEKKSNNAGHEPLTPEEIKEAVDKEYAKKKGGKVSLTDKGRSLLREITDEKRTAENLEDDAFDAAQEALIQKIEAGTPVTQADLDKYLSPDSGFRGRAVVETTIEHAGEKYTVKAHDMASLSDPKYITDGKSIYYVVNVRQQPVTRDQYGNPSPAYKFFTVRKLKPDGSQTKLEITKDSRKVSLQEAVKQAPARPASYQDAGEANRNATPKYAPVVEKKPILRTDFVYGSPEFQLEQMARKEGRLTKENEDKYRKMAVAIAEIENSDKVLPEHVAEALSYLKPDTEQDISTPEFRSNGEPRRGPGSPLYERFKAVYDRAGLTLPAVDVLAADKAAALAAVREQAAKPASEQERNPKEGDGVGVKDISALLNKATAEKIYQQPVEKLHDLYGKMGRIAAKIADTDTSAQNEWAEDKENAATSYTDADFTEEENASIFKEATQKTGENLDQFRHKLQVGKDFSGLPTTPEQNVANQYVVERRRAMRRRYADKLADKLESELRKAGFTEDEAIEQRASLWSNLNPTSGGYISKQSADEQYQRDLDKAKLNFDNIRKERLAVEAKAAAKQADKDALPYRTIEDIPEWKPSGHIDAILWGDRKKVEALGVTEADRKNAETKAVSEVEAILKRSLTNDEKVLLTVRLGTSRILTMDYLTKGMGEDLLWMLYKSTKATPKSARDKIRDFLVEKYGPIRLTTSTKKYENKPIKNEKDLRSVLELFTIDDGRYALSGFYVEDNGDIVVTDGRALLVLKNGTKYLANPSKFKAGKVYNTDMSGDVVEGNFPKYKDIIPTGDVESYSINSQQSSLIQNIFDNSVMPERNAPNPPYIRIDTTSEFDVPGGDSIHLPPYYFSDVLKTMQKSGADKVRVSITDHERPVLFRGYDKSGQLVAEAVQMPVYDTAETAFNLTKDVSPAGVSSPTSVKANTLITDSAKDAAVARQEAKATKAPRRGKSAGFLSTFDAEDLKDVALIMAWHVEKGARTAVAFTKAAIEEFGEGIRKHLPDIWNELKAQGKVSGDYNPDDSTPPVPPTPQPPAPKEEAPATVPPANEPPATEGTSIRNETVEGKRKGYGLPPLEEAERLSDQAVLDSATEALKKDPLVGKMLVDELKHKPRTVSVQEEGLLLHRMMELEKERTILDNKMSEAINSGNSEDRQMLGNMVIATMDEYQELTDITKAVGRDIARALRFRQRFVDDNYTLLKMETRMRAAVGDTLTAEEMAEIASLHKQLSEANARLKEALDTDTKNQARIKELEAQKFVEESKARSKSPRVATRYGAHNRIVSQERYEQVKKDLRERLAGQLNANAALDPRNLAAMVELGIYHIEAIGRKAGAKVEDVYKDWSDRMKADLGDKVAPHLKKAWDGANKQIISTEREDITEKIREAQTSEEDAKEAEIGRYIKKLAENFIASGITELNKVVDATHTVVKGIVPDITWEDTLNAFADYGRFRPLDQTELKALVRDKRRQALQVSKLLALFKKQPLKKTGFDRGNPTDEERELIKLVNEAKKEYGVETVDPEKELKSSLDAVKTRLRNEITDLDKQIASGEKIISHKTPLQYDAEASRLKEIRDAKKAVFDEIFADPAADAQKHIAAALKAVQKSQAEYDRKLAAGDISVKARNVGPTPPALEAARARRDAARKALMELREAAKPRKTAEEKVLERINQRIADYESRLQRGDFNKRPHKERLLTPAIITQQAKVDRIKREFDEAAYEAIMANKPFIEKFATFMMNIGGVFKSLAAGGEVSGIGRQLLPYAYVDPKTYADGVKDTLKAYKNPDYAKELDVYVENHPKYMASKKYGDLQYTKVGIPGYDEFLPSRLPEKIPLLGQLYKRGDAAFAAPQNKARLGLWDIMTEQYSAEGVLSPGYNLTPTAEDIRVMKRLGGWINDLSGRANLGRSFAMRRIGTLLNLIGFAPRYFLAKMKVTTGGFGVARSLLPSIEKTTGADGKEHYTLKGNFDRVMLGRSAKALVKFMAVNTAIAALAYLSDPDDNKDIFNPLSSDFYKVRVGNTRFDFTIGIAALVRLFSQLATGKRKSASGSIVTENRKDIFGRFIQSKESPLLGLMVTLWTGEDFIGKPISAPEAIRKAATMMFLNDAYDAYQNSGLGMAIVALGAGAVGVGVQSYPESEYAKKTIVKNEYAQRTYGKSWDDLTPDQQKALSKAPAIVEAEKAYDMSRNKDKPGEYKQPQDEFDAGKRILSSLPGYIQKKLSDNGIDSVGIQRKITVSGEDFYLNDKRFKAYEDMLQAEIKAFLPQLSSKNNEESIRGLLNDKKESVRKRLIREIKEGRL